MDKAKIEKQKDGTIKLSISIPQNEIKKARTQIIAEYAKTAKIDGFREGKAPISLVEKKIDPQKLNEEILKNLLPNEYSKAVQANSLKPIMNPKIHIEKMEQDKDWSFSALTCEEPTLELGDYKKNVQDITAKSKIVIPGKEEKKPSSQEIMKAISNGVKATIPTILIEQESEKLLSQLLNDIKRLGLSLDQYLASTNRDAESLKKEYAQRAEEDLKLEFALHKIAEKENISVEPKEIEEAIQKAKTDDERKNLESNRYMLAAILRQQKTLDFLLNL